LNIQKQHQNITEEQVCRKFHRRIHYYYNYFTYKKQTRPS